MNKNEILEKINAVGITEADIAAAFSVQSDVDLRRENEMLKVKAAKLEDQQRQAIDIANKAIEQKKIQDEVNRKALIAQLVVDSNGKWTETELDQKTTSELNLIKTCYMKSTDDTFASIAAYEAEQKRMTSPKLTAFGADLNNNTNPAVVGAR
jgi:hypothetical protein